jgi:hypothetical protein
MFGSINPIQILKKIYRRSLDKFHLIYYFGVNENSHIENSYLLEVQELHPYYYYILILLILVLMKILILKILIY